VDKEQANYAKWQEKTRKDVEHGFGILQSKFRILAQKVKLWSIKDIVSVTDCCLLLHNWMVTVRLSRDESEMLLGMAANKTGTVAIKMGTVAQMGT
jgi:hypothetical protein